MIFDVLDKKMRVFETAADQCVLPEIYLVARLDGRGFTKLTKETCAFEAPFDERFRDLMIATTEHLMSCGFNVIYGYTQSDEISLLMAFSERAFARKLRKYNSILAAEASAAFTLKLGRIATMDCRISQLPNRELVVDYFRWRAEDAARNAFNAHCYWMLRKRGLEPREASRQLEKTSIAAKESLLQHCGIDYATIPSWQKRGVGLYWDRIERTSLNPKTGAPVTVQRRCVRRELELPINDRYSAFLRELLMRHEDLAAQKNAG